MFITWEKNYHNVSGEKSTLYTDICNSCASYQSMKVAGSKCTTCHECTHGLSAELRNSNPQQAGILEKRFYPPPIVPGMRLDYPPKEVLFTGSGINAFYIGNKKGAIVNEPSVPKSSVAQYVPRVFQHYRYETYVTGQTSWREITYLLDEQNAYIAGAEAAVQLKAAGEYDEINRIVDGPIEFIPYITGMLMAIVAKETLDPFMIEFVKLQFKRSIDNYKALLSGGFPSFDEQNKIYSQLTTGNEGAEIRTFLKEKIGYTFDSPEPEPLGWDFRWMRF